MRQHCLQCWQVLSLFTFLTHILSTSSLGCNAFCMAISFLILWSICSSHSLVHFIIIIIIIIYYLSFSHQITLMVFHWSLSDSKSPQVSRTRVRILAVLSNAVVWKVSTRPPTSKSSRLFNNPLVSVPKAPITIGTIVTFMFHSFSIL